jgi:hypothetical protein
MASISAYPRYRAGCGSMDSRANGSTGPFVSGNFLLTVRPISRDKVSVFGGEVDAMTYNVSRSEPGQKGSDLCSEPGDKDGRIPIGENGVFRCEATLYEYIINLETLRFLEVYARGYVDGRDEEGNSPSITVGKCSRIQ